MDYDKIYEGNIDRKWFYSDYPGNKLVVGKISLKNAMARMNKNEYYALVTYNEGETLPEQYVAYDGLSSDDGTLFATINPDVHVSSICHNGGIQMISRLGRPDESIRYLLGPGPEKVYLDDLIQEQYDACYGNRMSM